MGFARGGERIPQAITPRRAGMSITPVCFLQGTSVLTPDGETPVERLAIGGLVETARGISLPVKWIGRQHFKRQAGSNWDKTVLPVRVSRFALDERTPHADLYLSPNHALLFDGVFIPAHYLINGTSIVQAMPEGVEEIEYFHIELETHEAIFVEGAAAETLLVMSEKEAFASFIREKFDNFDGRKDATSMTPYAPRVCYNGRRSELKALLRRAASQIADVRDPIQRIHDHLAARGAEIGNELGV